MVQSVLLFLRSHAKQGNMQKGNEIQPIQLPMKATARFLLSMRRRTKRARSRLEKCIKNNTEREKNLVEKMVTKSEDITEAQVVAVVTESMKTARISSPSSIALSHLSVMLIRAVPRLV